MYRLQWGWVVLEEVQNRDVHTNTDSYRVLKKLYFQTYTNTALRPRQQTPGQQDHFNNSIDTCPLRNFVQNIVSILLKMVRDAVNTTVLGNQEKIPTNSKTIVLRIYSN